MPSVIFFNSYINHTFSRQQTVDHRQQTVDSKKQTVDSRIQTVYSRQQTVYSIKQTVDSRQQTVKSHFKTTISPTIDKVKSAYSTCCTMHSALPITDLFADVLQFLVFRSPPCAGGEGGETAGQLLGGSLYHSWGQR